MPEACQGGQPNCCKPVVIVSWIVLLIVVTFVSLLYFRDCRYYAHIKLRSDEKLVFYFALLYMLGVAFSCYAFIVLAKTGAACQCCTVTRIVWAVIHVGLGITVFILVYPYKSKEIMARHPTEAQKRLRVITRIKLTNPFTFPAWFIQFHQTQKCCGLFQSYPITSKLMDRCDQAFKDDPTLQRGCGWVLYELYDVCTRHLFWYSVATLCLGLIPFVIFALIFRDKTKTMQRGSAVQPEPHPIAGPVNKEEPLYDRQGSQQLRPEDPAKTDKTPTNNNNNNAPAAPNTKTPVNNHKNLTYKRWSVIKDDTKIDMPDQEKTKQPAANQTSNQPRPLTEEQQRLSDNEEKQKTSSAKDKKPKAPAQRQSSPKKAPQNNGQNKDRVSKDKNTSPHRETVDKNDKHVGKQQNTGVNKNDTGAKKKSQPTTQKQRSSSAESATKTTPKKK